MPSLSVPAAILIGCSIAGALAGIGLYAGLRARPVPVPVATGVESTAAESNLAPESSAPKVLVSATAAPEVDRKAAAREAASDANKAMDAEHAKLVHDCWEPSAQARTTTGPVSLTLMIGYGADGHPITRALRANGSNAPPDVAACVNREATAPDIAPPGARTKVEVEIRFP